MCAVIFRTEQAIYGIAPKRTQYARETGNNSKRKAWSTILASLLSVPSTGLVRQLVVCSNVRFTPVQPESFGYCWWRWFNCLSGATICKPRVIPPQCNGAIDLSTHPMGVFVPHLPSDERFFRIQICRARMNNCFFCRVPFTSNVMPFPVATGRNDRAREQNIKKNG